MAVFGPFLNSAQAGLNSKEVCDTWVEL